MRLIPRLSLFFLLCLVLSPLALAGDERRPNVLLIVTDDQGYGDLGYYGNKDLDTPNLDALARSSARLERFYVSPVCSPTRASLLTGRYHLRTGASSVTRRREVMRPEEVTLAELFSANGYATAAIGKWHNGSFYPETPRGQGFGDFWGFRFGHINRYFDPVIEENGKEVQREGYVTDLLTDYAIDFVERRAEGDDPFFCYLAYNAPHTPALAKRPLYEKYLERGYAAREAAIYAMIESIDDNVGRLLRRLEASGEADRTIVIFMSDNGPNFDRYNAGFKGRKAQFTEGGVRVPCFVRWPGRLDVQEVDEALAHIDLLPTLVEWCGLEGSEGLELDGRSFAPLLEGGGGAADWPDRILYSFPFGREHTFREDGAARTERWLARKNGKAGYWELYDLLADPGETVDLRREYPWVVEALARSFEEALAPLVPEFEPTPVPVGLREAPEVELGAHDAVLVGASSGGIGYNYRAGYAHHWITGWEDEGAFPVWTLQVAREGAFEVVLEYCLGEGDEPFVGRVEVGDGVDGVSFSVSEAFVGEVVWQPFVVEGEAGKYASKSWASCRVGTVRLPAGKVGLKVISDELPAGRGFELKSIHLRRIGQ